VPATTITSASIAVVCSRSDSRQRSIKGAPTFDAMTTETFGCDWFADEDMFARLTTP
jgi:hypothetical protein